MNGRQLLVMDPSKLGLFNRAAAVRAGAATGAFGSFGDDDEPGTPKWAKGEDYATTPMAPPPMPWAKGEDYATTPMAPPPMPDPSFENYPGAADTKAREDWTAGINRFFSPDTSSPDFNPRFKPTNFATSPGPFILLGGAVLVGGIVLYTLFRR